MIDHTPAATPRLLVQKRLQFTSRDVLHQLLSKGSYQMYLQPVGFNHVRRSLPLPVAYRKVNDLAELREGPCDLLRVLRPFVDGLQDLGQDPFGLHPIHL